LKNEIKEKIIIKMNNNSEITEKELGIIFNKSERTIRRYIKELKTENKIRLIKRGKLRNWKIL